MLDHFHRLFQHKEADPLSLVRAQHTSIVAYGVEIWFGQGIHSKSPPGTTHVNFAFIAQLRTRSDADSVFTLQHGAPRKKIRLGETQLDKDTFFEYIEGMRETYRAERYHLLEFNCESALLRTHMLSIA